jgi:hypothetical protein
MLSVYDVFSMKPKECIVYETLACNLESPNTKHRQFTQFNEEPQ